MLINCIDVGFILQQLQREHNMFNTTIILLLTVVYDMYKDYSLFFH